MTTSDLAVEISNRAALDVIYQRLELNEVSGNYSELIANGFAFVKGWVEQQGLDPNTLLQLGIGEVVEQQLKAYECCIEAGSIGEPFTPFRIKRVDGGRFAVLNLMKDGMIGESIGRFFSEYVPANGIRIDPTRQSYEVYFEHTMQFCVPLLEA